VNQKTNFKYEVFVNDDASTDHTAEIIKEYSNNYPDIIKPIYQKENQYSKGVKIVSTYIYPKMKGKYIAICEGDDYWSDNNKLQKQVEFLNSNLEYSACVHNTVVLDCHTGRKRLVNQLKEDADLKVEEILQGGSSQFHTSSLMYRREYFYNPESFILKGVGDYPKAIYLSLVGKIHYFKEAMSVYRLFSDGSWTSRMYACDDASVIINHNLNVLELLNAVDEYSYLKYHETIGKIKRRTEFEILLANKEYRKAFREYKDCLKERSKLGRLKLYAQAYCPSIYIIYKYIMDIYYSMHKRLTEEYHAESKCKQ
jgi:glycosyltransferase involved in cell wall biosynthesis